MLEEPGALSSARAEVSELGRRAAPGLRLCAAVVATMPCAFLLGPVDISAFFSSFDICESGVGGRTITCAPKLVLGEVGAASSSPSSSSPFPSSSSELCGDMNRAVGRGTVFEGPLLFLRMGGGRAEEFFETLEECRPLEESLSCLECIAVVLAVVGPRIRDVVYN